MNQAFDVYVWRRCGYRVLLSARASPADELRMLVAHLDRIGEASWAELIGCHLAGQQYAGDWLEEQGLCRDYARQMVCLTGAYGPQRKAARYDTPTRMRDNTASGITRHTAGREDWLTEEALEDTEGQAREGHTP